MSSAPSPELTDKDEHLPYYLVLLVEALGRQLSSNEAKPKKSWWQYFVEPMVLTSLITVTVGGLFGGLITSIYQEKMKQREAQQASIRSRSDLSLIWYKEHLIQEQEVLKRTYGLLGNCVSASERLISQTGPAFRENFTGANKDLVDRQQSTIKRNFNETKAKWYSERLELSLLISYYYPPKTDGDVDVLTSWSKVDESVVSYLNCAEEWNNNHQSPDNVTTEDDIRSACKPFYNRLASDIAALTKQLEAARQYPWKQAEMK